MNLPDKNYFDLMHEQEKNARKNPPFSHEIEIREYCKDGVATGKSITIDDCPTDNNLIVCGDRKSREMVTISHDMIIMAARVIESL